MPILVQWKWKENTKIFLVIFHFYDDFSKPNLRFKGRQLKRYDPVSKQFLSLPSRKYGKDSIMKSIMTWAPSHRELALPLFNREFP